MTASRIVSRYFPLAGHLLQAGLLVGVAMASPATEPPEYPGKIWKSADEVLSGEWEKKLPPALPMPYAFDNEGLDSKRLSAVPAPGVHPRIFASPSDIEAIRQELAKPDGDKILKLNFQLLKDHAAKPVPADFQSSHWDFVSILGCKALLALVNQDEVLGKEAAALVVKHAEFMEPYADGINKLPLIRDNFYNSRSIVPSAESPLGFKDGLSQLQHTGLAQEYDYAYPFMTEAQRDRVRKVISKLTHNKYTAFMDMPAQFSMNNHISLGTNFLFLALAIEGEPGYDPRITELGLKKFVDQLAWNISPAGLCYEDVKGFINQYVLLAYGRRQPELLKMDRLMAMVRADASRAYYVANQPQVFGRYGAQRTLDTAKDMPGLWICDSGVATIMQYFYPRNEMVDFVYKSYLTTHNFDQFNPANLHEIDKTRQVDLQFLLMREGIRDAKGVAINYNKTGLPEAVKKIPVSWIDPLRGLAVLRDSWSPDALMASYWARNDFYYGGHETADYGDFQLTANQVEWAPKAGGYMSPYFHNMMLIDGVGPTSLAAATARIVDMKASDVATTVVSDHTNGWNWTMLHGGYDLKHPMYSDTTHFNFNRGLIYNQNRDTTVPVPERIRKFYEGYAHKDYGSWHGENRGVVRYKKWFPIDYYYRTFHFVRGIAPYILVMDDARVDGAEHQFDWGLHLTEGARLVDSYSKTKTESTYDTPHMPKDKVGTDFLFTYGEKVDLKKIPDGTPMLLVRVLWLNNNSVSPPPAFSLLRYAYPGNYPTARVGRISVPAHSVDPEYRILIFPHKMGDPLPDTSWNDDRSRLTVSIGDQKDTYVFDRTTGGSGSDSPGGSRVAFVQYRDGVQVASSNVRPPQPRLASLTRDGQTLDVAELGYPNDLSVGGGTSSFADRLTLALQPPKDGHVLLYRLDGQDWKTYDQPVTVTESARFEAKTQPRKWIFGQEPESEVFAWNCVQTAPLPAGAPPSPMTCRVYEYRKDIYNADGFYTGKDPLLLNQLITSATDDDTLKPIFEGPVSGLAIPAVKGTLPMDEMAKATYVFSGTYEAPTDGTYSFKLNAPGPLYLEINGKRLIENLGPHRTDQHDYFADIPLAKGTHQLTVAVTDPVFWKGDAEEPMKIALGVITPGAEQPIRYTAVNPPEAANEVKVVGKFATVAGDTQDGFIQEIFNRSGISSRGDLVLPDRGVEPAYFDLKGLKPVQTSLVSELAPNFSLHGLFRYTGFYYVAVPGVYRFALDGEGANQLLIHDTVVAQNGVDAPKLGEVGIELAVGWHPIDLRLAKSSAALRVWTPLGDGFEPINPSSLACPKTFQPQKLTNDELLKANLVATGPGEHKNLPVPINAMTVMMWVKQDPEKGKQFDLFEAGKARIRFGSTVESGHGQMGAHLAAGHGIPADTWYHLAITHDTEAIKYWVNGKPIGKQKFDLPSRNHHWPEITIDPTKLAGIAELKDIRIYNSTPSDALLEAVMKLP